MKALDRSRMDAFADLESQRDDALAYLSAMKAIVDTLNGDPGLAVAAQRVAQVVVRELAVETCAVCLRDDVGRLSLVGAASQSERFGGPSGAQTETGLLALGQLVGPEPTLMCFQRSPEGGYTAVASVDLTGEGCVVLPFAMNDGQSGAILLHWLTAPAQTFARSAALGLMADAVGQVLAAASAREASGRLVAQLETELGVVKRHLDTQEEGIKTRSERIAALTDDLIKSNRAKTQFLATVSHELRTPLMAILGYGNLLHEGMVGELNDEQRRLLDRVVGSSNNLHALIDDILFFVHCEADSVKPLPEEIPLPELVESVLAAFPERPAADRLAVRVAIAPEAEKVVADPRLVKRILFHLVGNAFKFTSDGEVSIAVNARPAEYGVEIVVTDTGIGIEAEKQGLIFESFTQGDGADNRRYEGMGMGLTLVQRCAQLLGGEVTLDSTPGVGSTFRVRLPGTIGAKAPRPVRSSRVALS